MRRRRSSRRGTRCTGQPRSGRWSQSTSLPGNWIQRPSLVRNSAQRCKFCSSSRRRRPEMCLPGRSSTFPGRASTHRCPSHTASARPQSWGMRCQEGRFCSHRSRWQGRWDWRCPGDNRSGRARRRRSSCRADLPRWFEHATHVPQMLRRQSRSDGEVMEERPRSNRCSDGDGGVIEE